MGDARAKTLGACLGSVHKTDVVVPFSSLIDNKACNPFVSVCAKLMEPPAPKITGALKKEAVRLSLLTHLQVVPQFCGCAFLIEHLGTLVPSSLSFMDADHFTSAILMSHLESERPQSTSPSQSEERWFASKRMSNAYRYILVRKDQSTP